MVYLIKIQKEFLKRGQFYGYFFAHRALNTLLYETRVEHVQVVCDEIVQVVVVVIIVAVLHANLLQ